MAWSGDWPTGLAFLTQLVDSGSIRESRNSNLSQLSDPEVGRLLAEGRTQVDAEVRAQTWGDVDARVLDLAAVLPIAYERVLCYRSPQLTNVFVSQAYGMYDVAALGLSRPEEIPAK